MRATITFDRYRRLCRMIKLLAQQPYDRDSLRRKLGTDVRGFYRDLLVVREAGVPITLRQSKYVLGEGSAHALGKLPFPDPMLSTSEASTLSRGSSAAHRRLRDMIDRATR